MESWGNIYYLKAEASEIDLWNCIKSIFPDYKLPNDVQINFSFETNAEVFFWNCDNSRNLVEFCFTRRIENQKNTFRIVFDKKLQTKEKGKVHALFYKEIAENANLIFCYEFFPKIKSLVPKSYANPKIQDDTEIMRKKISSEIRKRQIAIQEQNPFKIIQNIFDFQNELKEILNPCTSIKFCADENGKFFFPEKWIDRFLNDLWFLNANFVKSYGLSIVNKEFLFKVNPELRKLEKRFRNNEFLRNKFNKTVNLDLSLEALKKKFAQKIDASAKIIVKSGFNEMEITPNADCNSEIDDSAFYEELRNEIVYSVDYRFSLDSKLNDTFPQVLEEDVNTDRVLQEKIAFRLKETGFDEKNLKDILSENENLKIDNEFLKNELKSVKSENEKLKKKIDSNADIDSFAKSIDSNAEKDFEKKISDLSAENKSLQDKIKELQDENQNLKSRVNSLERKNEKSVAKPDSNQYTLNIPCSQKELYPDEIIDYLYKSLYEKIADDCKNLPQNQEHEISRKCDVINTLLKEKKFDYSNSETEQKLERIEKILKATNRPAFDELEHEGFVKVDNTKNHPKVYFYDKRYQITFSLTPSDKRVYLNKMKEIIGRFFLVVKHI